MTLRHHIAGISRTARVAMLAAALSAPVVSWAQAQPAAVVSAPAANIQYAYGPRGPVNFVAGVNGAQITIPVSRNAPAYSRKTGVQLSVDTLWPGQFGYRPVTFTARVAKPATGDKQISVLFNAGSWNSRGEGMSARKSFTLKQGATSASAKILVPQYESWNQCGWEVSVDGQKDDYLGIKQMGFANYAGGGSSVIGVMGTSLHQGQENASQAALQNAFQGQQVLPRWEDEKNLPTDWVEYSSLDVFIIPAEKLAVLKQDHPKRAAALLRWVRAGGNLWLLDAGSRWQRLEGAEQALDLPPDEQALAAEGSEAGGDENDLAIRKRGWRFAPLGERALESGSAGLLLSGFDVPEETFTYRRRRPTTGDPNALSGDQSGYGGAPAETSRRWFAVRGYGLGAVTAFRRGLQDSFSLSMNASHTMNAVNTSALQPRLTWTARHGNSPDSPNAEFNNLLIPGVGMAPVGQFQFLITLFVLGIGPLNYWLLKRKNKLPLLLATAPAAAALTTAFLFSYGLLADGFGVQMRSRTLTLLDQRVGEAASWGRLSYYAGIAPRGGLALPADQALYPILPRWATQWRSYRTPREVAWRDQQRLTRGWLSSRTPTQYQAIAARRSTKKLELRVTDDGLRIVNRLGVDVVDVAVQDHAGKFYLCQNLPAGEGRIVPASDQTALAAQIRRQFTAHLPEFPSGEDSDYRSSYYGFALSQSVMEGRLEAINSAVITGWGNGTYIAFTKQAVELDLGLDDVTEEASFHVIEGRW